MIRRETLSLPPDGSTYQDAMRGIRRVQRGESVRIVGLGTLARACSHWVTGPNHAGSCAYRITLTRSVAKSESDGDTEYWNTSLLTDVRHLAAAIDAPVEVWAYSVAARRVGGEPDRITTVQP